MSIARYLSEVPQIPIESEPKKVRGAKETARETRGCKALAGDLIWIGCGELPHAAVISSYMKQKTPWLTVGTLIDADASLKEMKNLRADIVFISPTNNVSEATVTTFPNAALNIFPRQPYGQTGIITGIRI